MFNVFEKNFLLSAFLSFTCYRKIQVKIKKTAIKFTFATILIRLTQISTVCFCFFGGSKSIVEEMHERNKSWTFLCLPLLSMNSRKCLRTACQVVLIVVNIFFVKVTKLTWKEVKGHWDVDFTMVFTIIAFPQVFVTRMTRFWLQCLNRSKTTSTCLTNWILFIQSFFIKSFFTFLLNPNLKDKTFSYFPDMSLNGTRLAWKVKEKQR